MSEEMCPWKVSFVRELKEPAYTERDALAGRDARTLADEILVMTPGSTLRRS